MWRFTGKSAKKGPKRSRLEISSPVYAIGPTGQTKQTLAEKEALEWHCVFSHGSVTGEIRHDPHASFLLPF